MKKISLHILYFLIVIVLLNNCSNNINNAGDNNEVVPSIKSVTKWQCNIKTNEKSTILNYKEYSKDGHLIKEIDYSTEGSVEAVSNFTYSNAISMEQINYYNIQGSIDSTNISKYVYNTSGYIAQKINYNSIGDTLAVYSYEYNSKGYIIKSTEIQLNTMNEKTINYEYSYNSTGSISSVSINNGMISTKDSINYEPNTNKVITTTYTSTGDILTYKTYTYNKYGQVTSEIINDSNDTIISKEVYEYIYY
jgi:hypothetical protein